MGFHLHQQLPTTPWHVESFWKKGSVIQKILNEIQNRWRSSWNFIFFIFKYKKYNVCILQNITDATCLFPIKELGSVCCNNIVIDCENQMTRALLFGNLFWTSFLPTSLEIFFIFYILAFIINTDVLDEVFYKPVMWVRPIADLVRCWKLTSAHSFIL